MKKTKSDNTNKNKSKSNKKQILKVIFWFVFGASLGFIVFTGSILFYYKQKYSNKVYPGVYISSVDFGGKTKNEVYDYFENRNKILSGTEFNIAHEEQKINLKAIDISAGYDSTLLSEQAYMVGRNESTISSIYLMTKAYINGVELDPSYKYNSEKFMDSIKPFTDTINVEPVNAQFTFEDGKVLAFQSHKDGKSVDVEDLENNINKNIVSAIESNKSQKFNLKLKVKTIEPEITMEEVNNLGIKEVLGTGTSSFKGSIENRIFNIEHATKKLNGILIKPGEEFSFAKAIGDISTLTGYKQAYVIQNGRTVLGDGGGVCQVSTTLFRAILNSGLPITERNAHAYRVSYYEQDKGPGFDAAVYVPSVDLKFKNDTDKHILIQTSVDKQNLQLTYTLYGTSDGRTTELSDSVILSSSPAPEALYQDDPELPNGQIKQVDFAAPGARVYFTRVVKRDGKTIIEDKFESSYRPWQAVYLRGTKQT